MPPILLFKPWMFRSSSSVAGLFLRIASNALSEKSSQAVKPRSFAFASLQLFKLLSNSFSRTSLRMSGPWSRNFFRPKPNTSCSSSLVVGLFTRMSCNARLSKTMYGLKSSHLASATFCFLYVFRLVLSAFVIKSCCASSFFLRRWYLSRRCLSASASLALISLDMFSPPALISLAMFGSSISFSRTSLRMSGPCSREIKPSTPSSSSLVLGLFQRMNSSASSLKIWSAM
mmetsp:Transcript_40359/g.72470  ORF Transcript_40359/g.72470 Transcript_40359/m.72470 type:complete len:230 (-) Transcript_40359:339-1028(-)